MHFILKQPTEFNTFVDCFINLPHYNLEEQKKMEINFFFNMMICSCWGTYEMKRIEAYVCSHK